MVPSTSQQYTGRFRSGVKGIGKIAVGQAVRIRLDDYPYQEFGTLQGRVESVSAFSGRGGERLVLVALPAGLKTSSGKSILFATEMSGSADVITEDLRLLDRFFYKLRNLYRGM